MYNWIILYVTFSLGLYSSAFSAILSIGNLPFSSPNSTFTLIWLSGFLWERSTTVSTCRETMPLMSKVFDFLSLELFTKNRFEGSCPRGISYRQTGIYRIGFPIFILRHHSGANPSSAQYSSILNIKPSFNCMKLTT